jgi:tetratricopeptide (TPR) repeat protein
LFGCSGYDLNRFSYLDNDGEVAQTAPEAHSLPAEFENMKIRSLWIGLALIAILACGALAVSAARIGLARYAYGSKGAKPELDDFERAVRLAENDPEPHLKLAESLDDANRNQEAIRQCERALSLRPNDQFAWLELGYLRKRAGNLEGARQAFSQAVALAPFYGQPHWRLGKCLLDMGRRDEAFAELRTAVHTRPSYLPDFIELVWNSSGGDPKAMADSIRPNDSTSNLAVGTFLAGKERWEDAVHFYHGAGDAGARYLRGMVRGFVEQKRYVDAYRVWQTNHSFGPGQCLVERGCLYDPGFENTDRLEDTDFVWSTPNPIDSVYPDIDEDVSRGGKKSLRVQFQGDSNPGEQIVTQLVLVRPSSRYRLTFKAKTKDLKSIALPRVSIVDAGAGGKIAEAPNLSQGTNDWQDFEIEFTTSDHTDAVTLILNRTACKYLDCPIFGTIWLDDFTLEKQ